MSNDAKGLTRDELTEMRGIYEAEGMHKVVAAIDMALAHLADGEDARRYRWLRENNEQHCDEELPHVTQHTQDDWGKWYDKFLTPEELDAAIDAARKSSDGREG